MKCYYGGGYLLVSGVNVKDLVEVEEIYKEI